MIEIIKNEITDCINSMSEKQLENVLKYVKLISNQPYKVPQNIYKESILIQNYIGGISHGSLASDIDNELYG